ncbi:hypothetical protein NDU88_004009 [Pleurodeles waltl]|uniref:Uncharacterized protein n=1 Tax=Pleurodeles waltl TaxID=8319 RepID=A0AAV7RHF8_PLEWA|nr:hypothetical protein NDU88_004009 [Pleurodeles waltl]
MLSRVASLLGLSGFGRALGLRCGRTPPPGPRDLPTCWKAACAARLPIIPAGAHAVPPPPGGFPPTGDGGPHDLPGWTPYGLTYFRCTPELLVGPYQEDPELLRRISGGSETLVTASYPQRAAPIRQLILPFTGVPYFGSLHIVLAAHVPQTPRGIFIYVCTRRGDGQLRRGEQNCWKRPDAGDYWTVLCW